MIYTEKQIDLLSDALEGNEEARKKLLEESKSLAALEAALRHNEEATYWLLKNEKLLAAFDDAVAGNKSGVRLLLKKKEYAWAAVANYIKGDDEAFEWLKRHKLTHFMKLAYAIKNLK